MSVSEIAYADFSVDKGSFVGEGIVSYSGGISLVLKECTTKWDSCSGCSYSYTHCSHLCSCKVSQKKTGRCSTCYKKTEGTVMSFALSCFLLFSMFSISHNTVGYNGKKRKSKNVITVILYTFVNIIIIE